MNQGQEEVNDIACHTTPQKPSKSDEAEIHDTRNEEKADEEMDDITDSGWDCFADYPLGQLVEKAVRDSLIEMGNRSPTSTFRDMIEYGIIPEE